MKVLGVSAMIKNTNTLKALAAVKDQGINVVLATTTKKDDAEIATVIEQNMVDADVVIVGLGSDNTPYQIEVGATERAVSLNKPLILLTDWPGSIRGRTENRLSVETLTKVALAIVPKGDGQLAREVCPSAQVLETHHPDIEGAEEVSVSRETLRKELEIDDNTFVAIIPGGKTKEVNLEVLSLVRDASLQNVVVLFLQHPGEENILASEYEGYGARVIPKGTTIAGEKASGDLLLPMANVFLNIASTLADRAGFLRIPVLWAQTPKVRAMFKKNSGDETPKECKGDDAVALSVRNAVELQECVTGLRRMGDDLPSMLKSRQEKHYPLPTPARGSAGKSMVNVILEITK